MSQTTKRIGFACKFSELDRKGAVVSVPELNTKTTTIAWLNRQSRDTAEQRLWDIMKHNIQSLVLVMQRLSTLDPNLRMFRCSSDILPAYTHEAYADFWRDASVKLYMEREFARVGDLAREHNIRLSFHPGQFCCLASENDNVVRNSVAEFEYHATMARLMGFGQQFQDIKINVHLSGKRGIDGFLAVLPTLSTEARNAITLENDEYQSSIDQLIKLKDRIAIVLDVHHHFIQTGEYIQSTDPRIQHVIESWRGVRPVIHYSLSREDYLTEHCSNTLPNMSALLASGLKKQKLRAHSDFMWNSAANNWAATHLNWADIMVESKAKNLASFQLAQQINQL